MKVVVLGASGMLGHAVFRTLDAKQDIEVFGTVRSAKSISRLPVDLQEKCFPITDINNDKELESLFGKYKANTIVNCIGLVKQLDEANNPVSSLTINSLLPHRLAHICGKLKARLIHISTDCVFSGKAGNYSEDDFPDAADLYGRSKLLGEVTGSNSITLRTSIIGHELQSSHGLIGWFLKQRGQIKGFTNAIFSGLPTCELAKIISDHVLPRPRLAGLYHVSSNPISKYDLLELVNRIYNKNLIIEADAKLKIDRSLNSSRFQNDFSYTLQSWPDLVKQMCEFK